MFCFLGWAINFYGLMRGLLLFGYEQLASLSCMGKDGKIRNPCLISNTMPLSCKKKSPENGLAKLDITMKRSTNVMSPTSNCTSIAAIGVSNCPFATMIWKSGKGPSFWIIGLQFHCVFQSRPLRWPWIGSSYRLGCQLLNVLENATFLFCFFYDGLPKMVENLYFHRGLISAVGQFLLSMTDCCVDWFGWKKIGKWDSVDVPGNWGLIVHHRSSTACHIVFDTCESSMMSSSSICSNGLL